MKHLKNKNEYRYNEPDKNLLDRFESPFDSVTQNSISIKAPEFTSLCPITGQPDFAIIVVNYVPDSYCLESKAFKLYLGSFRMHGEFHEACVNRIMQDLIELLQPQQIRVEGQFMPRGGISFWPVVTWTK